MTQFEEIFAALQSADVRYVVVGDIAVRPQDLIDIEKLKLKLIDELQNERAGDR